ncbi:MAG: helix-turn-helix domain-containing protein [Melioribacteraceae bacterium]
MEKNNEVMNQPTELQKQNLLTKVLSSPEFHDSKRYQELLQYLVDKSKKVETLKETEIAHEVFGKDSKFDPNTDPLIRSYISNLRKKLEHYYLTTTDEIEYKIEIPKGHYLVKYSPNEKYSPVKQNHVQSKYFYIGIILLLAAIFIWREFGGQGYSERDGSYAEHPVWKEFLLNHSLPTIIVLGDYLVLSEKGKIDGRTFLRVPQINSEKALNDSTKLVPGKYSNYEIAEVTFVGAGASMGLPQVLNVFNNANKNVIVKLSNELTWADFQKNNIVYLGTLKSLYKLDTLFSRSNIRYSLEPNTLKLVDGKNKSQKQFTLNWHGGNYEKNYSVILKLMISNKNSVLFLTGFSEVSVMDAIKSTTEQNFLSRINSFSKSEVTQNPLSFEMISETEGVRYTVFKSKIKHFSPIGNSRN